MLYIFYIINWPMIKSSCLQKHLSIFIFGSVAKITGKTLDYHVFLARPCFLNRRQDNVSPCCHFAPHARTYFLQLQRGTVVFLEKDQRTALRPGSPWSASYLNISNKKVTCVYATFILSNNWI